MRITVPDIARVAHEANRSYCHAIGDNSQPTWDSAPDWQRKSAINGVLFHYHNPDAGPSASHDNWLKEKEADGWQYGPRKDPDRKLHPCCVPYDKLPAEQRAKDYIFRTIAHELLPFVEVMEVLSDPNHPQQPLV